MGHNCCADLDPLRYITADLNRENDSRRLSQPMTMLYGSSRFVAGSEANLLYVTVAALIIPPVVLKMSGVNEPCSSSRTRCLYVRRFSLSCLL